VAKTTYVALLRGINVGRQKRVRMEDLRTLMRELGAEDVRTHLQSGNVVFKSQEKRARQVAAIEKGIRESLGLDVTVVLRTNRQLAKVVGGNPFLRSGIDPAKLHVAFLGAAPRPARLAELDRKRFEPDELEVVGQEVYLHYPNGYGKTKLSNTALERQLAVAATTRNWRTVTRLAELAAP
jgi:uncharacterized protein (DUF1697 family)